ncbi:hypothetical protein GQ53DRAFT_136205 [Thozetella sp. PMI_491]|nr:hypothetical protein GQ53DRAFT_136205 [Thozetella sp. PMI_491]
MPLTFAEAEDKNPLHVSLRELVTRLVQLGVDLNAKCDSLLGIGGFCGYTSVQVALLHKETMQAHVFLRIVAENEAGLASWKDRYELVWDRRRYG